MKMGLPAVKTDRRYTYADYRTWPEDERWELIHGEAWNMSAAPSLNHQRIIVRMSQWIATFLEGRPCEVIVAPLDVFFPADAHQPEDEVDTVVQPDLVVVCDPGKLYTRGCRGAPDWVIEILSPYTSSKDMHQKRALYQEQGVREYWIIDPAGRYVHVYLLGEDGQYGEPSVHVPPAALEPAACQGLEIDLRALFDFAETGR